MLLKWHRILPYRIDNWYRQSIRKAGNMKRVNQMLTILSYSNMQCLQNEDFTYWGGKLRLQCAKHDSPVAFKNKKPPWTVKKQKKNYTQNSWIYLSDSVFDFIDIFSLMYLRKDAYWLCIVSFCLLDCHADCGNCRVPYRPVSPSGEHAWRRFPNGPWPWGSWNRRECWAWGHWISARSVWNDSALLRCLVVYMLSPVSQATIVLFQSRPAQSRQELTRQSTCIIVVLLSKINKGNSTSNPLGAFNNSILSI